MKKRPHASDATLSVHAGEDSHGRNAPLTTAIQQTAVFALKDIDQLRRYAAGDAEVLPQEFRMKSQAHAIRSSDV